MQFHLLPPANSRPIGFTATVALTGGSWSDPGTVTWTESFDQEKMYDVVGMQCHSATGYAMRLVHKTAPWNSFRPGVPAGDTNTLMTPFYAYMGSFKGNSPPTLSCLASGNDFYHAC